MTTSYNGSSGGAKPNGSDNSVQIKDGNSFYGTNAILINKTTGQTNISGVVGQDVRTLVISPANSSLTNDIVQVYDKTQGFIPIKITKDAFLQLNPGVASGDAINSSPGLLIKKGTNHSGPYFRCETAGSTPVFTVDTNGGVTAASLALGTGNLSSANSISCTSMSATTVTGGAFVGNAVIQLFRAASSTTPTFHFGTSDGQYGVKLNPDKQNSGSSATGSGRYYFLGGTGSSFDYGIQLLVGGASKNIFGQSRGAFVTSGASTNTNAAHTVGMASNLNLQFRIGPCIGADDAPALISEITSTGVTVTGAETINGQAAGTVTCTVKAPASPTVAIQEWKKNDNTVLSSVTKEGYVQTFVATGLLTTTPTVGSMYLDNTTGAERLYVYTGAGWKYTQLQ